MPKIEIEETDFLASQATIRAVNGMLANPTARKLLLQARKTADPHANIPEIDAAVPVQSELAAFRTELAAERAERAAEKKVREEQDAINTFKAGWERQKSQLRNAGWRDEGIDAVVKHAEERGIPDLEVAAAHFEKLNPPPEPVQPSGSGSWGFLEGNTDDDAFVKKMIESKGDDEAALNAEINASLKEYRQQTATRR